MSSSFDHAEHLARAESDRLQSRAVELNKKLADAGATGMSRREIRQTQEELNGVMERLQLTQHNLDTWAEQRRQVMEILGDAKPPPEPQKPMLNALAAASQATPDPPRRELPLGQQLLEDFRRLVRPTLEDQLEGLDSPFQPPSVISVALERTLRLHMNRVRAERQEANDAEGASMTQEFGRALVELMRALTHDQHQSAPKGIEAWRERVRTWHRRGDFHLWLRR